MRATDDHRSFRRLLLAWYAATGRDLGWRRTRDPYAVLVSEFMLQQTQVTRVEDTWPAFLERFPTVQALAAAAPAEVVDAWRGLGYNRRAVHLHRAARTIVADHGGVVPCEVDDLEALPGVGPYTARAVAAFAYGRRAAPVDTNIRRVLTRGIAGRTLAPKEAQVLADALVAGADGGAGPDTGSTGASDAAAWSHALMDLGARRCTAGAPRCGTCPVAGACAWRLAGFPEPDPAAGAAVRPPPGRFEDSDRYHRGRLVDALREGELAPAALAGAAGLDDATRLERIVGDLVRDGLAEWRGSRLALPRGPG